MPMSNQEKSPSGHNGKDPDALVVPIQPGIFAQGGSFPAGRARVIACEVGDGLPTVHGKGRAHYVSHQEGSRMLVLERSCGDRIRINATVEVTVVEIGPDEVKIAIETVPALVGGNDKPVRGGKAMKSEFHNFI